MICALLATLLIIVLRASRGVGHDMGDRAKG
jgi:hypothetical protein